MTRGICHDTVEHVHAPLATIANVFSLIFPMSCPFVRVGFDAADAVAVCSGRSEVA